MTEHTTTNTSTAPDLTITRVFEAPRALVFETFTEPKHVKRWWGPQHFTAPEAKIDLRVGGKYHFCMRSPDGQDFWSTGTYREIVRPERLVYTDSFADADGNVVPATHYGMSADFPMEIQVTVTFEAVGPSQTRVTLSQTGRLEGEIREQTSAGWNQSFDKIAAVLADA